MRPPIDPQASTAPAAAPHGVPAATPVGDTFTNLRRARPRSETGIRARIAFHRVRTLISGAPAPFRFGDKYVLAEDHGDRGLLGEGGMGVVYAVTSTELGRVCVAKFMLASGDPERVARFRREAVTLAKFTHPNIVQVYDSGTDGDDFYIIMEYVPGEELCAWIDHEPGPDWRDVLSVFVQAGDGLAEAHGHGVVHRDFTPRNVRVTPIGDRHHARVLDFGLASGDVAGADDDGDEAPFKTRGALGTPGYMSPEQCRGEPATASSDQFSFCVCLYQALFRALPFGGLRWGDPVDNGFAAYVQRSEAGAVIDPGPPRGPLRRLYAAIARGLAPTPAQRFASMHELLAVLRRELERPARIRRGLGLGGLVLGCLLGGAFLVPAASPPAPLPVCVEAGALDEVWHDASRRVGQQIGDPTLRRSVLDRLDGFRAGWSRVSAEVCRRERADPEAEAPASARACLERHRGAFVRVVADLVGGAAEGLDLGELPSEPRLLACLQDRSPPLTDAAARAAEDRLAESEAALVVGRYADSRAAAEAAVRAAEALAEGPLHARALYQLARAQTYGADAPDTRATLRRAALLAERHHMADLAADIHLRLVRVSAVYGSADEARTYFEALLGKLAWLGEVDGLREAEALQSLASLALHTGDLAAAAARIAEVERLRAAASPFEQGRTWHLRGRLLRIRGDNSGARAAFERALELQARELGPNHPKHAFVLAETALTALDLGDRDGAAAALARARALPLAGDPGSAAYLDRVEVVLAVEREDYALARAVGRAGIDRFRRMTVPRDLRDAELSILGQTMVACYEQRTVDVPRARDEALQTAEILLARFAGADPRELVNLPLHLGNALYVAEDLGDHALAGRLLAAQPGPPDSSDVALAVGRTHLHFGRLAEAGRAAAAARVFAEAEASSRAADAAAALIEDIDKQSIVPSPPH